MDKCIVCLVYATIRTTLELGKHGKLGRVLATKIPIVRIHFRERARDMAHVMYKPEKKFAFAGKKKETANLYKYPRGHAGEKWHKKLKEARWRAITCPFSYYAEGENTCSRNGKQKIPFGKSRAARIARAEGEGGGGGVSATIDRGRNVNRSKAIFPVEFDEQRRGAADFSRRDEFFHPLTRVPFHALSRRSSSERLTVFFFF